MIYRYGLRRKLYPGLPPHKRLERLKESYHRMMIRESRVHGNLTAAEIEFMDNLKSEIDRLEDKLGIEKPEPLVVEFPEEKKKKVSAMLRKAGYKVNRVRNF